MNVVTTVPVLEKSISQRDFVKALPFFLIHLSCFAAFLVGVDALSVALCVGFFLIRKFGITAGYHRLLAHCSFKTSRVFQFLLAWAGCSATQKGPLWWSGHHRWHHQYSDTPKDLHSPLRDGFWWAHVGWFLSGKHEATNFKIIPDFAKFPELRWLNRNYIIPPLVLVALCYFLHGWRGVIWGYAISTTILWHTTFFINSACHVFGKRRFPTHDTSRNSFWLAMVTLGEGWHNNHHYFPSSENQGFYWWELDVTHLGLMFFKRLGLVWDVRRPPVSVLEFGLGLRKKRNQPPTPALTL